MADPNLEELAAEAYVYGFPLVFNLEAMGRFTTVGMDSIAATPFNHFGHASQVAGPNDTVYSVAPIDVRVGPQLLRVPDTGGRYYVLQFLDAWTNTIGYVGGRVTGTGEARYVLVPPGWDDGENTAPVGATVITLPTTLASIVGRWACSGPDDLPAVVALQQQLSLSNGAVAPPGLPDGDERVPEELMFFEQLRVWMHAFPPATRDREYQQRFAPLGLLDAESPYVHASPELTKALVAGKTTGQEQLDEPSPADARLKRAIAARAGVWASTTTPLLELITRSG